MSVWRDEEDFMRDIRNLSIFYTEGSHNDPKNKFAFKPKKTEEKVCKEPWYESDSDGNMEEECIENITNQPGKEMDSHELRDEIRNQVRSIIGNRYNNEVIEKYYNVHRDTEDSEDDSPNIAPEELSTYTREESLNNAEDLTTSAQTSQSENVNSLADIDSSTSLSDSSSRSNKCTNSNTNYRGYYKRKRNYNRDEFKMFRSQMLPFHSKKSVNINSKEDFPPL